MQGVRIHALAQLAYEGIMDDLAAGGGAATKGLYALSGVLQNTERISSNLQPYSFMAIA